MKKLIINDTSDYFINIIQPKLDRLKVQDPFDDYQYKTLNYYNKNVWQAMNIKPQVSESDRVARSRAFSLAKNKIFFNSDLRYFITLTYRDNMQDYEQLKTDIKVFLHKEKLLIKQNCIHKDFYKDDCDCKRIKYLWVAEKQKRGALHVHMICNDFFTMFKNKYGKLTIPTWQNGFSNIENIKVRDSKDTDINFKPFLYMYKYMNKSERIGGRFVHSSRNLNNFTTLTDFNFNKKKHSHLFSEHTLMGSLDRHLQRKYYKATE